MTISLRTIKITLATVLAILLAEMLQLDYAVSAGIIAILSVLDTKISSLKTAGQRIVSTIVALTIAAVLFQLVGFTTFVFGLYLLIYVPIAYKLNVQAGIAPCSVLVSHLLLEQSTSFSWLMNEFFLMVIGASLAVLFNLYMPSKETQIQEMQHTVDEKIKGILLYFDQTLREGFSGNDDYQLIQELETTLDDAIRIAYTEFDNQLMKPQFYEIHYFEMRKVQASILKQMATNLRFCHLPTKQNKILAGLFYLTAQQLHESNPGTFLMQDIQELLNYFRTSPLPQSREEFENRAVLFQLLNEFTRFIETKQLFYEKYAPETK